MLRLFSLVMFLITLLVQGQRASFYVIILCGLLSCIKLKAAQRHFPGSEYALLGFFMPLLGALSPQALLSVGLFFLLLAPESSKPQGWHWARPYLCVLALWALCYWILFFDWQGLNFAAGANIDLFSVTWWSAIRGALLSEASPAIASTLGLGRVIVLVCLFAVLSANTQVRARLKSGIAVGLAAAALIFLSQLIGWLKPFSNYSAYWQNLGRLPGSFSDPNACGLFVALCLPFLFESRNGSLMRWAGAALGVVWLALACFSGSRSLFAALAVYGFVLLRTWRLALAFVFIVILAALNFWESYQPESLSSLLSFLPLGLKRVIQTALLSNYSEAFFSRAAFWQIGFAVWLKHVLFGVGYENFRSIVPEVSAALGFKIGTWSDNPNNFYLGVLAETGLVGALSLGLSLARLSFKQTSSGSRSAFWALLVLLLLGPHTDFTEISLLAALLLAENLEFKEKGLGYSWLLCLVSVGIVFAACRLERGFYAWEGSQEEMWRWTGSSARGLLVCGSQGQGFIKIRALNPDLSSTALTASISAAYGGQELVLKDHNWHEVLFVCPEPGKIFAYKIRPSRVWSPAAWGQGADRRLLGLQVMPVNG